MGNRQPLNIPSSWIINKELSQEGYMILDYQPTQIQNNLIISQGQLDPLPSLSVNDYLQIVKFAAQENDYNIFIRSKSLGDDLVAYLLTQSKDFSEDTSKEFLSKFLPSQYQNGKFIEKDGTISFVIDGDYDRFMENDKAKFESNLEEGIFKALKEIINDKNLQNKLTYSEKNNQISDEEQMRANSKVDKKQDILEITQDIQDIDKTSLNLLEAITYERGSIRILLKGWSASIIAYLTNLFSRIEQEINYCFFNKKLVRDRNGFYYIKCK